MKIDPPPEPVNVPPVTPVPSRKRPEDIETAPSFGAWTSPAFFQRSHASFGGLVDSSVDPFAEEEDGFIPGKGRKRPRFSMRSSEWRVVDEPASPGEKASPVDWTEELEAEVDEDESAAENIEIPQKSPEPASVLPDTQETLDSTSFGYSATSTGQLAPETGPTREEPVEPLTPTPASYVNGKEDLANSLQIPISSPHLRPVPSPGLPVPSPFASSTPGNGYLISDLAPTTQPSTTVTQSHEVIGDSGVPKVQPETVHVDTEDSNLKAEGVNSYPGHTAPVEPQLQTASEITEQVPEDVHSEEEEEEEEEEAVAVPGDVHSPSPDRESPVKNIPHMGVPDDHSDDVEMVDENEDEDEYLEDEMEQAAEHEPALSVERSQENPESEDEETAESPVEAQEPAADHHEPEEISEEDEDDQEDEDMNEAESDEYESESGYEDREEDIVDSEMESDEDEDEIPREVPTQAPPSNTQPDVIVLDSDDEDEPPVVPQIQQPQHERESEDVEQHALSPAEDRGEWPSDEEYEMGDETMAERQSDAKVDESEDGHAQDERVEEVDEDEDEDEEGDEEEEVDEEEEYEDEGDEDEEEKEASAAEERQRNGFHGEQPEQISLLDDDETEKSEDEHAQDAHVEEDVDEKEEYEANSPEDDQRVEDREEEDLTAYAQAEAQAEVDTVEYDTNKDEGKGQDQGNVSEGNIQGPELLEPGHTGQDEDARAIVVEQAEGHSDRQEVELVDRTSRAEDKPDKDRPDEEKPDESDADSQDEFVESSEFLAAPEVPPPAVDPTLKPLNPEQQLESNAAMIYDGAPSPPGAWYDAPTDLDESASELQDDEANGPSQQLAAEHEQQLHALAEARGNTPAIEITGTPEAQPWPRSHSIKQEEKEEDGSYTGLRSKYSYFAPLATLADHFNTLTDTISVIHDFSPITQAQAGPRDHILTLHLTDPSMAGTTLLAHLARPYPEALPQHPREGDAILLRNFKPKPFNRAMSLVSDDTSAWAVFPDNDANNELVPGPPVEYGVEERSYASGLRQWYRDDGGAALVADVSLQTSLNYDHDPDQNQDQDLSITSLSPTPSSNASISDSSDLDNLDTLDAQNLGLGLTSGGLLAHRSLLRHGRRRHRDSPRRGRRRITIHELRDGRRYTEVGSPSDRESIHELRDGTVYANL